VCFVRQLQTFGGTSCLQLHNHLFCYKDISSYLLIPIYQTAWHLTAEDCKLEQFVNMRRVSQLCLFSTAANLNTKWQHTLFMMFDNSLKNTSIPMNDIQQYRIIPYLKYTLQHSFTQALLLWELIIFTFMYKSIIYEYYLWTLKYISDSWSLCI
jgi:hypothetical protein